MSATYRLFLLALLALLGLQYVALALSLYWIYLWFDIPMHALGGAVVVLGYLTLVERLALGERFSGFAVAIGTVLFVGLGWELFEFLVGGLVTLDHRAPLADTVLDVIMDLVGGGVGYGLALLVSGRRQREAASGEKKDPEA